jgi:hypothetical protein
MRETSPRRECCSMFEACSEAVELPISDLL